MPDQSHRELKSLLKQLKAEKGIASRAVGQAKKENLPSDELIQRVKDISAEIRQIEDQIKAATDLVTPALEKQPERLPPQFGLLETAPNAPAPEFTVRTDLDDEQWDEYVNRHPHASAYHSSSTKRVIVDSFGHKPVYLAAVDTNGKPVGALPLIEINSTLFGHSLTSMPFFNYGGVIADHPAVYDALIKEASRYAQACQAQHIEMRHSRNFLDLPSKSVKVAMILQLPDNPDKLWSDIGTKVRAQIKKSRRVDATVKIGREELVDDFYRVFSRNMRDLGTPVYPKKLFTNMVRHNPSANIIALYRQGHPVAAGFVLGWRDTLEIPWASTLREANRFDANMRLYWEILKFAIDSGYRIFDFGRSSKKSSTYRFKKQWGAKAHDLYWHYWLPDQQALPQINKDNPKYRLVIETWKRLPLFIANLAGPFLVKNIP